VGTTLGLSSHYVKHFSEIDSLVLLGCPCAAVGSNDSAKVVSGKAAVCAMTFSVCISPMTQDTLTVLQSWLMQEARVKRKMKWVATLM